MAARTDYIVLRSISQGPDKTFQVVGTFAASSASHAKRQYAEKAAAALSGSETFVAIPARSWAPQSVTTSTKTIVKLGAAKEAASG